MKESCRIEFNKKWKKGIFVMDVYVRSNGKIFGPLDFSKVSLACQDGLFSQDAEISEDRIEWLSIAEAQELLKPKKTAPLPPAQDNASPPMAIPVQPLNANNASAYPWQAQPPPGYVMPQPEQIPGQGLSLLQYFVSSMSKNYCNFNGRARRREFWGFALFAILFVYLPLMVVSGIVGGVGVSALDMSIEGVRFVGFILGLLCALAMASPTWSLYTRRVQDIGISGKIFLPVSGVIVGLGILNTAVSLVISTGLWGTVVSVLQILLGIAIFVIGFIPGQDFANQYGEDPLK